MDPKKYNRSPPRPPITPAEARMGSSGKVWAEWVPNLGQALLSEVRIMPPQITGLYPSFTHPILTHTPLSTEDIHSQTYAQMLNDFFDPPTTSSHGSSLESATVETVKKMVFKPLVTNLSKPPNEQPSYEGGIVYKPSPIPTYFRYAFSFPEYTYFSGEMIPHKISGPPPLIIKKPERKLKRPSYLSTRRKSTKREKRFSRPLHHRVARLR